MCCPLRPELELRVLRRVVHYDKSLSRASRVVSLMLSSSNAMLSYVGGVGCTTAWGVGGDFRAIFVRFACVWSRQ